MIFSSRLLTKSLDDAFGESSSTVLASQITRSLTMSNGTEDTRFNLVGMLK